SPCHVCTWLCVYPIAVYFCHKDLRRFWLLLLFLLHLCNYLMRRACLLLLRLPQPPAIVVLVVHGKRANSMCAGRQADTVPVARWVGVGGGCSFFSRIFERGVCCCVRWVAWRGGAGRLGRGERVSLSGAVPYNATCTYHSPMHCAHAHTTYTP